MRKKATNRKDSRRRHPAAGSGLRSWRVTYLGETWYVRARGYRQACKYALRRYGAYETVM